jgi:hypothetical protein
VKLDIEAHTEGVNSYEFMNKLPNVEKLSIFDKNGQKFFNGVENAEEIRVFSLYLNKE